MAGVLICGRFRLDLSTPKIMAILNVTPDSFSGDGLLKQRDDILRRAERAVQDGAHVLDLGGESSRPGAAAVSEAEELDRVIPIVEALAGWGVPLSVDTVKPAVMTAAIGAGADMINDINALRTPGALAAVAASGAAVCLMHMQGAPRTMQDAPHYDDVVAEVEAALVERMDAVCASGVVRERILIDPGFGFGKTLAHNLGLFRALPQFAALAPVLVGVSRKSMLGALTGQPVEARLVASAVAAALAVQSGAVCVRVHDVAATRDALAVLDAVMA
ncbi:dihydropteroate synthase [Denitromonas ohlonensis]|uniref:dihydropteroate synthase n=2 Tax=Denitromonas TaxID=139331 RepID=A0A558EYF8_9RHOO|nr:dihydropteroate synthase [Denitromonas ohlonensis]TVO69310.1 dihydropteroate synthase [Denitromonas ohlonensis]TVO77410.1 dihydropteroate synthase [Denitromonas ohlonensis]TVT77969.1 MAG: dihydropteroate synthase [Denitromonas halophila]